MWNSQTLSRGLSSFQSFTLRDNRCDKGRMAWYSHLIMFPSRPSDPMRMVRTPMRRENCAVLLDDHMRVLFRLTCLYWYHSTVSPRLSIFDRHPSLSTTTTPSQIWWELKHHHLGHFTILSLDYSLIMKSIIARPTSSVGQTSKTQLQLLNSP